MLFIFAFPRMPCCSLWFLFTNLSVLSDPAALQLLLVSKNNIKTVIPLKQNKTNQINYHFGINLIQDGCNSQPSLRRLKTKIAKALVHFMDIELNFVVFWYHLKQITRSVSKLHLKLLKSTPVFLLADVLVFLRYC